MTQKYLHNLLILRYLAIRINKHAVFKTKTPDFLNKCTS